MHKSVLDLIPILKSIETVLGSSVLTAAQRHIIINEMTTAIPDPIFCPTSRLTLSIINTLVESNNGSTKPAPSKDASATKEPKQIKAAKRKPAGAAASNSRGTSKAQADVGKPQE